MRDTNTIRVSSLASFLVLILLAVTGYAQSGGSTIRGTVTGPEWQRSRRRLGHHHRSG